MSSFFVRSGPSAAATVCSFRMALMRASTSSLFISSRSIAIGRRAAGKGEVRG
jgi:hypothetical protein